MLRTPENAKNHLLRRRAALVQLRALNADEERTLHDSIEPDWPDRAAVSTGTELVHGLAERERREIEEIDAALRRIADGVYGRCDKCGHAVGRQRLFALPEARRCAMCAELGER